MSDPSEVLEGYPYILGDGKIVRSVNKSIIIKFSIIADVSKAVMYLLSTPYNVNVTELTIRPVGEKF